MPREEDRINALANYLEIDPAEIKEGYRENLFETEDGEEYFVVTEDEGYELAKEDIESLFDDLGIQGYTPDFQEWIFENAVDENFIDSAIDEEIDYLRSDGEDEDTADWLEDLDYIGKVNYFKDSLGEQDFSKWISDNNAFDFDAIADEAISWDGVAHFVAGYDGKEIELEDDLFAYRWN